MKIFLVIALCPLAVWAAIGGSIRGKVEDSDRHRVPGASVILKSSSSDYSQTVSTDASGAFEALSVPVGVYQVTVKRDGFAPSTAEVVVASGSALALNFELRIGTVEQQITVPGSALAVNPEQMTPTTMISRKEIQMTPGADLSNSLATITDYVPGAWVTHDQLHVRGGHQVTWAIDGVPIPNTNIASNVGPQIDPKDIDYLEVQRGGYSAQYGDRSYGVFNIIPRTGFERSKEAELFTTFGRFHQTNNQVNFGSHTDTFGYFGSVDGNRSDYGLQTPGPDVLHDRVWGLGGMGTLIYNRDARNQFRFVTSARRDNYQIPNDADAEAMRIASTKRCDTGARCFWKTRSTKRSAMWNASATDWRASPGFIPSGQACCSLSHRFTTTIALTTMVISLILSLRYSIVNRSMPEHRPH
jgi:Carboxypeptidase regulatory-like domain/TonB-dependent Receptor Plug Domain